MGYDLFTSTRLQNLNYTGIFPDPSTTHVQFFFFSNSHRDKNGEVELHACGQWAFDVEKVGVKTIKAEK